MIVVELSKLVVLKLNGSPGVCGRVAVSYSATSVVAAGVLQECCVCFSALQEVEMATGVIGVEHKAFSWLKRYFEVWSIHGLLRR